MVDSLDSLLQWAWRARFTSLLAISFSFATDLNGPDSERMKGSSRGMRFDDNRRSGRQIGFAVEATPTKPRLTILNYMIIVEAGACPLFKKTK